MLSAVEQAVQIKGGKDMTATSTNDEHDGVSNATECRAGQRRPISKLGGVSLQLRMALRTMRITTCDQLLAVGSTPEGRRHLATVCGVELAVIEGLLGRADLIGRIDGIGTGFVSLLELHGITNSTHLADQCPTRLHQTLRNDNLENRWLRRAPTQEEIDKWIAAAKTLPPVFAAE